LLRSLERRVLWLSAKQVDHATGFGQSGGLADVLRHHRIDQNSIADAALGLVGRHPTRETTA
jgi:pyruvate dehydrogenase complex dehydrogenase (E1) component